MSANSSKRKGKPARNERYLFLDKGEEHGTVILNWVGTPEREFRWYAEYFHEAAKALVQLLRDDLRFGLFGLPGGTTRASTISKARTATTYSPKCRRYFRSSGGLR